MAYIASIHRASSVRHAVRANFLNPDECSLIVAKSSRVEIYSFASNVAEATCSLILGSTFTVYGQITVLLTLRPENSPTDHLLIATDRYDYFTVSWDEENQTIRNERTARDLSDRFLRNANYGAIYIADPRARMLGLHIYQGIFTVIPLIYHPVKSSKRGAKVKPLAPGELVGDMCDPAPLRLHELKVVDMAFLDTPDIMVAMLHEDGLDAMHLKVFKVKAVSRRSTGSAKDAELEEVKLDEYDGKRLDPFSKFIVPVPESIGGMVILGEQTITYISPKGKSKKQLLPDPTVFATWGKIDDGRYLLGDDYGKLYVLVLDVQIEDREQVVNIKVSCVGKISTPSRLVYLSDDYVYVGSHLGDSQLLKLEPDYTGLTVVQTFSNLAPVIDFRILDMGYTSSEDQQHLYSAGQTRIVSGSGAFHDGSLRSLRSGVSLEDLGILGEMVGIRGLWGLKSNPNSEYHDTLLVSFIDESRLFRFNPEGEVEELENLGQLSLDEEVLAAANVCKGRILHVTPSAASLVDAATGMTAAQWHPDPGTKINHASANEEYLLLATMGTQVVLLDLNANMMDVARRTFEHEVASLSIPAAPAKICMVGLWTASTVSILDLPDLVTVLEENVGEGGAIPRSLFLGKLLEDQPPTLMIAMGDGRLSTYSLNESDITLSQQKNIVLGVQPVYLQPIPAKGGLVNIFATCDHPSLVYGCEGRIVYSAITVRGAEKTTVVTPFNAEAFPQSVVVASDTELKIMIVDPLRTTHIQTLKVGDVVRRVSHSKERRVFGIVTIQLKVEEGAGIELFPSFVRLVDDTRFDIIDTYPLVDQEFVESIICAKLENGDGTKSEKFIVGTGFHDEESDEPNRGRILVFELGEERKLKLACKQEVAGGCKCLEMVGDYIVAALQKTVAIYIYHHPSTPSQPALTRLHSYRVQSEPIDISVYSDIIAVGDMMKGVCLLSWNSETKKLTEVARNYRTQWVTAITLLDRETIVSADAEGNVVIQKWDINGVTPEDKRKLQVTAEVRIGEMVNRFRNFPTAPNTAPIAAAVHPTAYFATVEGSLYLLALISPTHQDILMKLQQNLARVIRGIGDLEFNRYRSFSSTDKSTDEPFRFVDGDFLERFLDLGGDDMRAVVEGRGGVKGEDDEGGVEEEAMDKLWRLDKLGDGWGIHEVKVLVENLRRLH